jgi:hypothetical protein
MIRRLYEDDEIYDAQTEWLNNVPLDELFVEIRKRTGIRELRFTSEMKSNWRHENYISIKSNDIADKTGFLQLMFRTLFITSELSVSQGDIDNGEPEFSLWGTVGFKYKHPDMGGNGYNFLRCWYDDINGWQFREVS